MSSKEYFSKEYQKDLYEYMADRTWLKKGKEMHLPEKKLKRKFDMINFEKYPGVNEERIWNVKENTKEQYTNPKFLQNYKAANKEQLKLLKKADKKDILLLSLCANNKPYSDNATIRCVKNIADKNNMDYAILSKTVWFIEPFDFSVRPPALCYNEPHDWFYYSIAFKKYCDKKKLKEKFEEFNNSWFPGFEMPQYMVEEISKQYKAIVIFHNGGANEYLRRFGSEHYKPFEPSCPVYNIDTSKEIYMKELRPIFHSGVLCHQRYYTSKKATNEIANICKNIRKNIVPQKNLMNK